MSVSLKPGQFPRPLRIAAFALAAAVLLWLSLAPSEVLPTEFTFWDKAEHSLAYLVLTGLGFLLFPRHPRLVIATAVAQGAGIEVLQSLMGFGRQGDWRDMVANLLGAASATGLWLLVRRLRAR